jgi:hypothetical protein
MGQKKILTKVNELMQAAGVDINRAGGIPELEDFKRYLSEYRIVILSCLRYSIMFEGQLASPQRVNLLLDVQHYHVITNHSAAMAKRRYAPRVNRGDVEIKGTDATLRAMRARPFLHASRTKLG